MQCEQITRNDIERWLFEYQPYEINFKKYYEEYQKLLDISLLYKDEEHISHPQRYSSLHFYTDLKSINPNYHSLKESLFFKECDWFHPFENVSLQRAPRFFPEFRHTHEFFEICYVLKGECTHTIYTNGKAEEHVLSTGDIIILPQNISHAVRIVSDSAAVNILVKSSTFKEAFMNNIPSNTLLFDFFVKSLYSPQPDIFLILHTEMSTSVSNAFYELAADYCNEATYNSRLLDLRLSIFFIKILNEYYETIEFLGNAESLQNRIPAILQYMEMHYNEVNISDIASHFHFTTPYFSKIIRDSLGTTPISILQNIRVKKAALLLSESGLSVEHIAKIVGYEDTTHFIRIFKKAIGVTPARYRKDKN